MISQSETGNVRSHNVLPVSNARLPKKRMTHRRGYRFESRDVRETRRRTPSADRADRRHDTRGSADDPRDVTPTGSRAESDFRETAQTSDARQGDATSGRPVAVFSYERS